MSLEFKECSVCAAKPGHPTLCDSCLHNRHVIQVQDTQLSQAHRLVDLMEKMLDLFKRL